MPPRSPDSRAPLAIAKISHLFHRHAQDILHDLIAAGTMSDIAHFRTILIVVDHPVQTLQRLRGLARFAGDIQRTQNRVIAWIMMRKLSGERRIFRIKSCLGWRMFRAVLLVTFDDFIQRNLNRNGIERGIGHTESIGTQIKMPLEKDSLKDRAV